MGAAPDARGCGRSFWWAAVSPCSARPEEERNRCFDLRRSARTPLRRGHSVGHHGSGMHGVLAIVVATILAANIAAPLVSCADVQRCTPRHVGCDDAIKRTCCARPQIAARCCPRPLQPAQNPSSAGHISPLQPLVAVPLATGWSYAAHAAAVSSFLRAMGLRVATRPFLLFVTLLI